MKSLARKQKDFETNHKLRKESSSDYNEDLQYGLYTQASSNKNLNLHKVSQHLVKGGRPISSGSHTHLNNKSREPMQSASNFASNPNQKSRPFSSYQGQANLQSLAMKYGMQKIKKEATNGLNHNSGSLNTFEA